MVQRRIRRFGDVPACARVHSEDCGNVTLDFGLLLAHILLVILTVPALTPFVNTLHSTLLCKWFFFWLWIRCLMRRLCSLAAPVKADPTAALFDKAEADHDKVYDCVFHHGFSTCYAA
jgi:hypothetical protein